MKSVKFLFFLLMSSLSVAQNPLSFFQEGGGRIILEQKNEYKGNLFVYDEWNKGMLVLNDSIFSVQDYLKYDAYNDRVLVKNMKNLDEIIEIYDNSLTGFSILDSKDNKKHDFVRLNVDKFENRVEGKYFEIVFNTENTNYFLKRTTKILYDPSKSKGTQPINAIPLEYRDIVTYYLKNEEEVYVEVKLTKKDILAVLNKHTSVIADYIKKNKLSFIKESDIMKLVNYYYSLK